MLSVVSICWKKSEISTLIWALIFFFPALIQTGLSATFKTVWHFFFSRRHWHPFYLQWLTWEQEVHMLMQIKRRRGSGAGGIPSGIKMRIDAYILYVYDIYIYIYIPRLSSEDVKNTYKNEKFTLLKERNFKERIWRNAEIYSGDVSGKNWSFFFKKNQYLSVEKYKEIHYRTKK